MIDFKEEVKKYKPVLEADDLERELGLNDANDVVKLLQYLAKKPVANNRDYSYAVSEKEPAVKDDEV